MTAPRYARLASKMLSQIDSVSPPAPAPDERAEAIAAVARAISAQGRRRRLRQGAASLAAVAAVVLAALAGQRLALRGAPVAANPPAIAAVAQIVAHPVGGGSSVVVSGAQAPLDDGRLLGAGSRVVTPANGRAMLSFSTGSSVLLREGTD